MLALRSFWYFYVSNVTFYVDCQDSQYLRVLFLVAENKRHLLRVKRRFLCGLSRFIVLAGALSLAENKLANIPREHHNKLARFLEAQGKKDLALRVTQDPEHQFELAWQLDKLQVRDSVCDVEHLTF